MKQHQMTKSVTTLSVVGGLSLLAACSTNNSMAVGAGGTSNQGEKTGTGGASNSGGTAGTSSTAVADAASEADPCSSGLCVPSGFPFVNSSRAITDACIDQGCPLLAADTPVGKTTATLSQPEAGTLCLSGSVSTGGFANLGLLFAVKNQDHTETLKTFDANSLGITQLEFTIDSPPSGGVSVSAISTIATSCPGDKFACLSNQFSLMTGPGSSVPLSITSPGRVPAPFTNFMQTVGSQSFDTSALDNLGFSVGPGNYDFCVHDFRFLDAQNNEVKP